MMVVDGSIEFGVNMSTMEHRCRISRPTNGRPKINFDSGISSIRAVVSHIGVMRIFCVRCSTIENVHGRCLTGLITSLPLRATIFWRREEKLVQLLVRLDVLESNSICMWSRLMCTQKHNRQLWRLLLSLLMKLASQRHTYTPIFSFYTEWDS